jgi:hypothetical protein
VSKINGIVSKISNNLNQFMKHETKSFDMDLPGPDFISTICVDEDEIQRQINVRVTLPARLAQTPARLAQGPAHPRCVSLPNCRGNPSGTAHALCHCSDIAGGSAGGGPSGESSLCAPSSLRCGSSLQWF